MPRYFVAIPLPDDAKDRLVAVQPPATAGMRIIGREEFHLTLHFLGEVAPLDIDKVRAALATIRMNAFTIALKGIGRFPPEGQAKVLWAGVEASAELVALHRSIGTVLADAIGFRPEERPYAPHISLARINEPAPLEFVDNYLDENRGFVISSVRLDRFALYSSVAVDGVPQYREEAVFNLASPDGRSGDDNVGADRLMAVVSSKNNGQLPEPDWKPQFSLRSMLVLTSVFAVWLSICRIVPHIAVFLLGVILAAGATYAIVRLKRKVRGCRLRRLDRVAFAGLRTLTLLSWAYLYVVSIGPVGVVAQNAGIRDEPLRLLYAPVIWLHDLTPLAKPLEGYTAAWGMH